MLYSNLSNKNLKIATILLVAASLLLISSCAPYQARKLTGNRERGLASWYGPGFSGKRTASGERFNTDALTAAHNTLPFGTEVQVTNLKNMKSIIVRINDRGPFVRGRIIDLSKAAAKKIGLVGSGTASVELAVLGPRDKKTLDAEDKDSINEALSASAGNDHDQGKLLAYNRRSKKREQTVKRNGVAYLIEQDEQNEGSSKSELKDNNKSIARVEADDEEGAAIVAEGDGEDSGKGVPAEHYDPDRAADEALEKIAERAKERKTDKSANISKITTRTDAKARTKASSAISVKKPSKAAPVQKSSTDDEEF